MCYLEIPFILICFSIIKVKSHLDVIQGIAPLSYLVKVSEFQRFKEHNFPIKSLERCDTIDSF